MLENLSAIVMVSPSLWILPKVFKPLKNTSIKRYWDPLYPIILYLINIRLLVFKSAKHPLNPWLKGIY